MNTMGFHGFDKLMLNNHNTSSKDIVYTIYCNMATILNLLPWVAAIGLLGSLYYIWYRVLSYQGIPKTLAFANSDGSLLSRARSSLGSVFGVNALLWAGYRDVRANMI